MNSGFSAVMFRTSAARTKTSASPMILSTRKAGPMVSQPTPKVKKPKAAAWLHTMHQEGGQKMRSVSFTKDNPWGVAGKNYSAEYPVTCEPLYLRPPSTK